MKKTNKLLIALLSATCLTAGAFGLAACNNSNETTDGITAVYNQYVSDTQAAGGTALSYTEWLKAVLSVGGKGDKGDTGAKGDKGDNGTNGKSAYEIYCQNEYANDRVPLSEAEWLASLKGGNGSNGTDGKSAYELAVAAGYQGTEEQWLASLKGDKGDTPEVHTHSYNDKFVTIIPATSETEGIGYKTCTATDCDHIELVVVPTYSYKFSVILPGTYIGESLETATFTPFEGATVTLKDGEEVVATATTDADGNAFFNDIEKKAYTYEITAEGYHVVYGMEDIYAKPETEEYQTDYGAILIKSEESGDGSEVSPYVITTEITKEGDGAYAYLVPEKEERHGYNLNTDAYFTFTAPKSGMYYLMDTAMFMGMSGLEFASDKNTYMDGMLFLNEGEQAVVTLKSDDTIIDFVLAVIVYAKELKPGTQMLPKVFEAGKEFTVTSDDADEDGNIYLKFTSAKSTYVFTSSVEGVEISYVDANYMDSVVEFGKPIPSIGVAGSSWETTVSAFKVKLPEGTDSVNLKVEAAPGVDAGHAIDLAFNTATKPGAYTFDDMYMNYSAWYKYVVTAENAGLKTLEFGEGGSFDLYSEDAHGENDAPLAHAEGKYPFMFEEGTYYIKAAVAQIWDATAGDDGDYVPDSFKIRDYNEATDKGLSKYAYLTVTLGTATDVSYRYFKYTAAEAGLYIVDGSCYVYSDADYKNRIEVKENRLLELEAEQSVYFFMSENYDWDVEGDYCALTLTKVTEEVMNTPVKYTIKVKDYNNDGVADVTVTVNGVSGTTDNDGNVELSIVPGEYEVELDFGAQADTYVYSKKVTTKKLFTNSEITANVDTLRPVSVMVSDHETWSGIEGVEVTVWAQVQGEEGDEAVWEQVGEAQTTEGIMGSATFTLLSGKEYRFKLANVPEKYKVAEYYTSNEIQLKEKSEEPGPDDPDNPDNPDDPKPDDKGTYLYKGWKDEFEGEQSYKLYTGTMYEEDITSIKVTVRNGYIKNLTAINVEYEDEAKAVIDGKLQEDNSGNNAWTGTGEGNQEVIFDGGSYTFMGGDGIALELEVVSYGGSAQVIIEKVSTKANSNFY